jgi:hypothetical protein
MFKSAAECNEASAVVPYVLLQAVMMDTLISGFVEEIKQKSTAAYTDEADRPAYDASTDSDGKELLKKIICLPLL